ncbi:MAG: hypothetical protein H7Y38_09305 [Armatimonadetes bacterium]|nr:hypothetical protein [Armatimonadota bacterium]
MPEPLNLDFARAAQAEVSAAIEYVRANGGDAERFADRVSEVLKEATARLAEEVADSDDGKPWQRTHAGASITYSQPVYRLDVETATKRKRGNSAGLWFAYYSLRDIAGGGKPDTMYIHAFRHSAGRPIGDDGDTGE